MPALLHPSSSLQALFKNAHRSAEFPELVSDHFSRIYASDYAFNNIPALDISSPPELHAPHALVAFRAMVQDTSMSPGMYLTKLRDGTCGGWGLVDDVDYGLDENTNYADLAECTTVWAVSIPGESAWCVPATLHTPPDQRNMQPHKFPISGAPHIGVQVKIYDRRLAEVIRTTDLLTFVGFLTSEQKSLSLDSPDVTDVPTLHLLFSRTLPSTIVPRAFPAPRSIIELRAELVAWVADEGLAGDLEVAEWVLLSAISRVQSRTPPILPLSLTVAKFPTLPLTRAPVIPTISHVLSQILPMLVTFPLSLDFVNSSSFSPESKDEDLHSGWLQLSKGSVAIISEGGISEGNINQKGLLNLRAVQEMINNQNIEYIFPFSQFSFETDVSVTVLAEGTKSAFFHTEVLVPLRPSAMADGSTHDLHKSQDQIKLPGSNSKLSAFREFVGGAMAGSVSIGEATSKFIQDDFVQERKDVKEGEAISADELVLRMKVAKLLALSYHSSEVTIDIWKQMKQLMEKRKARIRA